MVAVAVAVSLASPVLVGCSGGGGGPGSTSSSAGVDESPVDRSKVLDQIARDVIVPGYEHLGRSLADLEAAVEGLCAAPGEAALDDARARWLEAVYAWEATTAYDVGPAMEHRLMSAVAFVARPATIELLLEGDKPVDPESVGAAGAAVRGLFAAEHVLHSEHAVALTTSEGARRCEYLSSVVVLARAAADEVVAEWVDGDAREQFAASVGSGASDSLPMLLNAVTHRVKEVDERLLRDVAAAGSYDALAEGRRDGPGGVSLGRHQVGLRAAVEVIGSGSEGLVVLVRERSPETAERLEAVAEAASTSVDALPASVAAVWRDPETVEGSGGRRRAEGRARHRGGQPARRDHHPGRR